MTNVAVEALVRRAAPRKISKTTEATGKPPVKTKATISSADGPAETKRGFSTNEKAPSRYPRPLYDEDIAARNSPNKCSAITGATGDDGLAYRGGSRKRERVPSARLAESVAHAAEMVSLATSTFSRRVRRNSCPSLELPGVKRVRAAASVAGYVKLHYAKLGIPWPPKAPTPKEANQINNGLPTKEKGNTGLSGLDGGGFVEDHGDGKVEGVGKEKKAVPFSSVCTLSLPEVVAGGISADGVLLGVHSDPVTELSTDSATRKNHIGGVKAGLAAGFSEITTGVSLSEMSFEKSEHQPRFAAESPSYLHGREKQPHQKQELHLKCLPENKNCALSHSHTLPLAQSCPRQEDNYTAPQPIAIVPTEAPHRETKHSSCLAPDLAVYKADDRL